MDEELKEIALQVREVCLLNCVRCGASPAEATELYGDYHAVLCPSCLNALIEMGRGFILRAVKIDDERHHIIAQTHADGQDRLERLHALSDESARNKEGAFALVKRFVEGGVSR